MAAKDAMKYICPKGCYFSLSAFSAESENENQLCVLSDSSAAGGEFFINHQEIILNRYITLPRSTPN
jgi:hypothetical protein